MEFSIEAGNVLRLRVAEAASGDMHRGAARLSAAAMAYLGVSSGEVIQVTGLKATVTRAFPAESGLAARFIQLDGTTRQNAGIGLDEEVTVTKLGAIPARAIVLTPIDGKSTTAPGDEILPALRKRLQDCPVVAGDIVGLPRFTGEPILFHVTGTAPQGAVQVGEETNIRLAAIEVEHTKARPVTYEDVGGLERELGRVRELVELPLKYPALFRQLGVRPPRGVLLYGPPGTGKTLIARAIAADNRLHFLHVDGPEIMRKYYGESEARLREVFDEARRNAPAVIFLDEIDALAPRRETVHGDVEKRVVGQLLALMDGLEDRGDVIVVGATNIPELLDPALRRPGRFDREVQIPVPNRSGRRQILTIHTRGMALGDDVDLDHLADVTHGFVGADLAALCREAGMVALRRYLPTIRFDPKTKQAITDDIRVTNPDFVVALSEVEPSATRELVMDRPKEGWEAIGGLAGIRQRLDLLVQKPLQHREALTRFGLQLPRGILFTGPSGTGKTLVARALGSRISANFIAVEGPALFRKWMGETEKGIRDLFRKARQAAPCVLFIDDIDALAPARTATTLSEGTERAVSQLLAELDNLRDESGVIVLAATNRPDKLEPTLNRPGRFDYVIEFPLPASDERGEILAVHTRHMPLAPDVDLSALAKTTEGWTGASLRALCQRAALLAADNWLSGNREGPPPVVQAVHLATAQREMEGGPTPVPGS